MKSKIHWRYWTGMFTHLRNLSTDQLYCPCARFTNSIIYLNVQTYMKKNAAVELKNITNVYLS